LGWSGKKNGVLLSLAELEFDVLVTVDQGIEYEQNLANRKMAYGAPQQGFLATHRYDWVA